MNMTATQTLVNGLARFSFHLGASSVPIRLLAIVCLWLGGQPLLSPSTGAVSAQDRSAAIARITTGKIHLIMVADTDDNRIGDSFRSDLYHVPELFAENVPKRQLVVTEISGRDVHRRMILDTVGALKINPDLDTVVFYFSGHGAFDPKTKEHFFYGLGQRDSCFRSEIQKAIQQFRPQLTVILADTCSVYHRTPVPTPFHPPGDIVTPAFRALFLEPVGLIDINSSQPGQEAEGDSTGGWFTSTFCSYLRERQNTPLNWQTVLQAVNRGVKTRWRAVQTAYAVSPLPEANKGAVGPLAPVQGVRFGAAAERTARGTRLGGVEVTQVIANTPSTRMRSRKDGGQYQLVSGRDVITHINGEAITTYDEFRQAIAASPNDMVVRVYDRLTRSTLDYDVSLGEAGAGVAQPANRTRFGAYIQNSRSGVQVTGVMANSPATRCQNGDGKNWYLEAGDVITHVNGQPVQSDAEYRAAIMESPSAMKISVIGGKDRQRYEFSAQLND